MANNLETVNTITQAITAHAEPIYYDWLFLAVAIASVFASVSVAYFAYQLNKKQIKIATTQSEISAEQTQIAKKQTEVMEQQNKIALFEKRLELYIFFSHFNSMVKVIPLELFIEILDNTYTKYDKFMGILDVLLNLKRNNDLDSIQHLPEKEQLAKLQSIITPALNQFETIKFLFVLDKKDTDLLIRIANILLSIWITISGQAKPIQNVDSLLPLRELAPIIPKLAEQLYTYNVTQTKD